MGLCTTEEDPSQLHRRIRKNKRQHVLVSMNNVRYREPCAKGADLVGLIRPGDCGLNQGVVHPPQPAP